MSLKLEAIMCIKSFTLQKTLASFCPPKQRAPKKSQILKNVCMDEQHACSFEELSLQLQSNYTDGKSPMNSIAWSKEISESQILTT